MRTYLFALRLVHAKDAAAHCLSLRDLYTHELGLRAFHAESNNRFCVAIGLPDTFW